MTSLSEKRAFAFDTEFDASGEVVRGSTYQPVRRAFAPAEVEALIAQARLEAREAALAEVASIQAMALSTVAQTLASAAPALQHAVQMHREQSADLALSAARVVAGAALDRFPSGPLQTALEALGQEIDASPRLVVRTGQLDDGSRDRISQVCADAGFSGVIAFRNEPGMGPAAFQLEWADGRAAFDPNESFTRIASALEAALAAEAGHAETLNDGRP